MSESRQVRLADDEDMPKIGSTIDGRYVVKRVLGEGGFATVYACDDNRTKTQVAVKVLDPMMSRRGEFSARFLREIETVSRLRHHNTIKIFDSGETDTGCLFLVMELLQGEDLDEILEREGPLPPERVKQITMQVLKSLMEAHQGGVMHRDLKPANVFIADVPGETDYVKVLDFGIAKSRDEEADTSLTATGQVMCSPDYVAPERVRDHACFFSSDLYSLGIMMIEMLEGELPYKGETPIMVALQHARVEDPVPLKPYTANGPLGAVIQKATHKDPSKRYQTAAEMARELGEANSAGVPAFNAKAPHLAQGGGSTTAYVAGGETVTHLQPDTGEVEIAQGSSTRRYAAAAVVVLLIAAVIGGLFIAFAETDTPGDELADLETPVEDTLLVDDALAEGAEDPLAALEPEDDPIEAVEAIAPVAPVNEIFSVSTAPQGASVYAYDDSFLGATPFLLTSNRIHTFPATMRYELDGYETIEITIESLEELKNTLLNYEMVKVPTPSRSSRSSRRDSTSTGSSSGSSASKPAADAPPKPATPRETAPDEDEPRRSRFGSVRVRVD